MERRKPARTVGMHLGKPIPETIYNGDREYVFDRIAECDAEGCSLDQLKKNEVLIRPGLIYRPA